MGVEVQWLESGRGDGRDFSIAGEGTQRTVTGALWTPEHLADAEHTPVVLLGHGASGDRYQAPLPYLARRLVQEHGYIALAIDGPVHGLRKVGDGARAAFFNEMQRPEFIDDMVGDWQLALQQVIIEPKLSSGPRGYFGLSMGTIFGVPLLASSLEFRVATLGLCGTTGASASIGGRLASDAAQISHPLLFLMQLEDELFPRQGYLELFDAFGSADKRMHANPGLHPEVPAEEVDHALDFISARLAAEVPRRVINPLAE